MKDSFPFRNYICNKNK